MGSLSVAHGNLNSFKIPCGGTHLDNLYSAADVMIKRKGKSKGLESIYCDLVNLNISSFSSKFDSNIL